MVNPEPESCGIAFKEWASVCDALLAGPADDHPAQRGDQRGNARRDFRPRASEFWLYPTWVHQAEQGVRTKACGAAASQSPPADGLCADPCAWSGSI